MKKQTFIPVRGIPRTWGTGPAQLEWRKKIFQETKNNLESGLEISEHAKFTIEITFQFFGPNSPDLDNLAKPILDTLFKTNNRRYQNNCCGAFIKVDDDNVVAL